MNRITLLMLSAALLVGCYTDDTLEIDDGPDAGAEERATLPGPDHEGAEVDQEQVFYRPSEAGAIGDVWMPGVQCGPFWSPPGAPCNTNPPNCCTVGSCFQVTSNQWRCGYYIVTLPNGSHPAITDASCSSAYDIANKWHPGPDKKCHTGGDDPTCVQAGHPQLGWNAGPNGVPCDADDVQP